MVKSIPPSCSNDSRRSRWDMWVAKNALPKNHYFPRPKRTPTRFQRPGPMTEEDKKRFLKWAKSRTQPKWLPVYCHAIMEKVKKKTLERQRAARRQRLLKLAQPKWCRPKYVRPEVIYPYSPKINCRRPPHRDKWRPFQLVKLPHWWHHTEIEMDYWRFMRFPISICALKHKTTCFDHRMAVPRTHPPKVHCPYPPRDYSPPDRVRMGPKQWRSHLQRLEYLADPKFKTTRSEIKPCTLVSCQCLCRCSCKSYHN